MKRTRKKQKIDPNKVYLRIGQAVVLIVLHGMGTGMLIYGFMTATILNQEEKMEDKDY